jgi:thioredoxin reductase (NADPH)
VIHDYLKTGNLPELNHEDPQYYEVKAKNFLIATGTRPRYLNIEGAEHAITSDDIFQKKTPPGKTMIIGGGYIGVEVAGFLKGMGYEVHLMTRGEYLRGFDRDMVRFILNDLVKRKINVIDTSLPKSIKKTESGRLEVVVENQKTK